MQSLSDSLSDVQQFETMLFTDNKLDGLPSTIGNLQKLMSLDAHNNSLTELPASLWYCSSLTKINVTSNFISTWHDPPVIPSSTQIVMDGAIPSMLNDRKTSTMSLGLNKFL